PAATPALAKIVNADTTTAPIPAPNTPPANNQRFLFLCAFLWIGMGKPILPSFFLCIDLRLIPASAQKNPAQDCFPQSRHPSCPGQRWGNTSTRYDPTTAKPRTQGRTTDAFSAVVTGALTP